MEIPQSFTKLYVTGYPINHSTMGFLLGKHGILLERMSKLSRQSAILDVKFGYDGELKNLMKSLDGYSFIRIFKSVRMSKNAEKRTFETKTKERLPIVMGFVMNTVTNFLGQINGKKHIVKIECRGHRSIEEMFVKAMMKHRDEKKYDIVFDPEKSDIAFNIRRIETDVRCPKCKKVRSRDVYYITWVEGKDFTNN